MDALCTTKHNLTDIRIRLLGYSQGNTNYKKAKAALDKDWQNPEKGLSDEAVKAHEAGGGWIGGVIRDGEILIDVDSKTVFEHLLERLILQGIKFKAIETPNGGQLIFKDTGRVTVQGVKMLTVGGTVVDYRLADKGYIVLPSDNTTGRCVVHADDSLDDMPLFFLPVRKFREDKGDESLPCPIVEGGRDDTMFRHACRIREQNIKYNIGLSEEEIKLVMEQVNHFLCAPPMDDRDVAEKVRSALSYPVVSTGNEETARKTLPDIMETITKDTPFLEIQDILKSISLLPLESERSIFIQKLSEKTGIPKGDIKKDIKAYRHEGNGKNTDTKAPLLEEIEPWEDAVDGNDLLGELYAVIESHVVLSHSEICALALWVLVTYCYDLFRVLCMIAITSPEKRCGKTTLEEVLAGLVDKALLASNITPAAIYRTIERHRPCLIIDEADTFLKDSDELRGIVNSGHTKKSAFVVRVNLETLEPERFSTWGPKIISLIGNLPDTLVDRSISIKMKRKNTDEKITKINHTFDEKNLGLRRRLKKWAQDNTETLKNMAPGIPATGNDRAADNWMPLLCIADLAGGEWPTRARMAMTNIEQVTDNTTIKQTLLIDIGGIFQSVGTDKISSKSLMDALNAIEDHPWNEFSRGKPLTQNGLARLLKPFEIFSKTIRIGNETAKGYEAAQFKDTFERYLKKEVSPTYPILSVTTTQTKPVNDLQVFQSVTCENNVTVANQHTAAPVKECDHVTDKKGGVDNLNDVFVLESEQIPEVEGVTRCL